MSPDYAGQVREFECGPERIVTGAELSTYGRALEMVGRGSDALGVYRQILDLNPTLPDAANGYAAALLRLGERDPETIARINRDIPSGILSAAISEMALQDGDYPTGFSLCHHRWAVTSDASGRGSIDLPDWDGGQIDGPLLVVREQGLGEEILFSSCFGLIPPAIISCDPRLLPIFSRSFPSHRFVTASELPGHAGAAAIDAMGLMRVLNRDRSPSSWLKPDAGRASHIRTLLGQAFPGRTTVGVSWFSTRAHLTESKSIAPAVFANVLAADAVPINLQYGHILDGLREFEAAGHNVYAIDGVDPLSDLDGVLSVIAAVDCVVTCSNTVAHMAGAIGKPTILLAPQRFMLWYWGRSGSTTPWYPSVHILRGPFEKTTKRAAEMVNAIRDPVELAHHPV